MNLINPLKRQAQLAALKGMMNQPTADAIAPVGPLANIGQEEKAQMPGATVPSAPMTSQRGLKESMTKKLKPKV